MEAIRSGEGVSDRSVVPLDLVLAHETKTGGSDPGVLVIALGGSHRSWSGVCS